MHAYRHRRCYFIYILVIFLFVNVNMNGVPFLLMFQLILLLVVIFVGLCLIDWKYKSKWKVEFSVCYAAVFEAVFLFIFSVKLNESPRIPNRIELNRFIWMNKWMNGTVDLCRWHYQIHRIQLKFVLYVWEKEREGTSEQTNASIHLYGWKLDPSIAKHFIHCIFGSWILGARELRHNCKYWLHDETEKERVRAICVTSHNQATNIYLFIYLFAYALFLYWYKNNNAKYL